MPREEKVAIERDGIHDIAVGVDRCLLKGGAQVGQNDEKGADQDEGAEALHHKGRPSGAEENQDADKNKKQNDSVHENAINMVGRQMVQNKVVDRIAGIRGRIRTRLIIDAKAQRQKHSSP